MTASGIPYQAMLDDLERDLIPVERHRNELITTINVIRSKAGLPPRPDGGGAPIKTLEASVHSPVPLQIKSDTFVGKRLRSAARQYLEIRRSQSGDGPAKPRDIYEALLAGGFEFEGKDETIRLVSLRSMLRKRTETFKKLQNGAYGLQAWYGDRPSASSKKAPKPSASDIEEEDESDAHEENAKNQSAA